MILLVTTKRPTGLTYHRQLTPFKTLGLNYEQVSDITDKDFKNYSIVSFQRTISTEGNTEEVVKAIKEAGAKVHVDIDDYWHLPPTHGLFEKYNKEQISEQTIQALTLADFVTTTTPILADKIKNINKNVYVLPNAINPNEESWKPTPTQSDRVRVGYIAGLWHVEDIMSIREDLWKLQSSKELTNKIQLRPAGFNLIKDGERLYMNEYYKFVERLFTKEYRTVDAEYKEYLLKNTPEHNEKFFDKKYQRLWGALDVEKYPMLYNMIDISLVPLVPNEFSRCKSELKLIEAGFMKKPCVVSNVEPYNLLATKENCLLSTGKTCDTFYIQVRKLVNSKEMREDYAEALYEAVKVKHHINTVNIERKQILQWWASQ
jgi:hypothetical protein